MPEISAHFVPQAAVVAAWLALAPREARHVPPAGRGRVGVLLLEVSLAALALQFAHYLPVLSWSEWTRTPCPAAYSGFTSLFDLFFETRLDFSPLERANVSRKANSVLVQYSRLGRHGLFGPLIA